MEENSVERGKALEIALTQIEKQHGKGAIMRLGENTRMMVETFPTGSLALDIALGIGGIPRGRIVEVFGPEGSGKTTLTLHVLAEAQRQGGTVAFIDVEHALDPAYARNIGLDIDNVYVSQPDTGEEALDIADTLVRSGAIDAVVVDSVAALVPRAELEGEMGDPQMGMQARLMSQALRKLAGSVSRSRAAFIFTNQVREKIGVMFGNPETTPGGRALRFWASVRMRVSRVDALKNGSEQIGSRTKVSVVKNKVAPPFREAEFDIIFGKGISRAGDILDLGVQKGIIAKTGTWFSYGDERLGQGRENAREALTHNPDLAAEIENQIRAAYGLPALAPLPKEAAQEAAA
ncbi:MAG: recombinase RecA [Abditibacteriales bacterium]|nr:recombinase RecA [Abditibacteriales bacterium]